MKLVSLRKRSEFLRVRGGLRWACPAFVVEAKLRAADEGTAAGTDGPGPLSHFEGGPMSEPRFGFTVTKRLGGAVVRNRIRRRLKAVVQALTVHARDRFDYVVIARAPAHDMAFADLSQCMERAFERLHRHPGGGGGRKRQASGKASGKSETQPHINAQAAGRSRN